MVSQRSVHRWYRDYNQKFFANRLPKDIEIRFVSSRVLPHDLAQCFIDESIEINSRIRWSRVLVKGSLIHEMMHLYLPKRVEHGLPWKRLRDKLYQMGAFDDLI